MKKLFTVCIALFLLAGCGKEQSAPTKPVQPSDSTQSKAPTVRATLKISVDELIGAYNAVAKEINRSILLPPAAAMLDGEKNPNFHALNHSISDALTVAIEVDNASGYPFSISVYGPIGGKDDSVTLLGAIASMGSAIFGKGSASLDAMIKFCGRENADPKQDIDIGGMRVVCSNAGGVWFVVITTPGGYGK